MMKLGPIIAIVVFVVLLSSSLGSGFLWVLTFVSVAALGCLFFFMWKQDSFVGPRVIVDEMRDKLDSMGKDDEEEIVVVRKDTEE